MRKVIQITSNGAGDICYGLCDDGTLLQLLHMNYGPLERRIENIPIPQPDPPAPVARVVTDKAVNAALDAWSRHNDPREPHVIMRAALEAALAVEAE